jgi:hypothetical protein
MTTLLEPSSLMSKGLRVEQINNLTLFKFTEELGDRLQTLLDNKQASRRDNRARIERRT